MAFNVFGPPAMKGSFNLLGVAQPCHYAVLITPPIGCLNALAVLGTAMMPQLALMAESASLPSKQIATTDFTMYGTRRKMPYGTLYDDLSITFICSDTMVERTYFNVWQSYIANPANQYMNYYDDYVGTVVISKLSSEVATLDAASIGRNAVRMLTQTYVFYEAFPITVNAQELSWSADSYLNLTVNFSYRKWSTLYQVILEKFFGAGKTFPGWWTPSGLPDGGNPPISVQGEAGEMMEQISKAVKEIGLG